MSINGLISRRQCAWVLVIMGQLLACSVRPGRGSAGGSDVVQPLWTEQSSTSQPGDTMRCANVVALLIGIGQYDPAGGWEALSAQNDVDLMEKTLRQRGVRPDHIHLLTDRQATKTGIEHALKTLADTLSQTTQLLILYAGHARQLADDNGDEPDQYDEAIVPYDAPSATQNRPDGYLRDDELNQHLTRIRARLGLNGSLWLLFDSCHSETLNRGQITQRTRGGAAPIRLHRTQKPIIETGSDWYEIPKKTHPTALSPYVLFAATTDGGPSFETTAASGQSFGPLTRAVCEAWSSRQPTETYRQLFGRVAIAMARFAPYQQPGLEGDADALTPGCGSVMGRKPFSYQTMGERVRVAWPPQDQPLNEVLTHLAFVQSAGAHPDLRINRRGRGYEVLMTGSHQPLSAQAVSTADCAERIRQYFARNVLLHLQQTTPDFRVQTTMQRLRVQTDAGHILVTDTLPNQAAAGLPLFQAVASERVLLTLTNVGPKPFYLTVVDLEPDGSLHVLLPEADQSATAYRLLPGGSVSRRIRMTEPFGAEVYKLLLTPEPIYLRTILQTRGDYPARHPYEAIFQRTYATRGMSQAMPIPLLDKAGATAEVAFWVGH